MYSKAWHSVSRLYRENPGGLAVVAVHPSHAQRLYAHGDISILWRFTAEPSIGLQRFRNTPE